MPGAGSIESLPDELLGRIFQLVRQGEEDLLQLDNFNVYDQPELPEGSNGHRAALPAVCWRWCSVYWSSPLLWRQLDLFPSKYHLPQLIRSLRKDRYIKQGTIEEHGEQWLQHRCSVLEWIGHLVRSLTVAVACVPGELRAYGDAALTEALFQCTRLEELSLRWPEQQQWGAFGRIAPTVHHEAECALRQLSALTALTLDCRYGSALPLQDMLGTLFQLRRLDLVACSAAFEAATPQLALLTGLCSLRLSYPGSEWCAVDRLLPLARLVAGMSALDSLAVTATLGAAEVRAVQQLSSLTSLTLRFDGQLKAAEELRATLQHLPHMADLALRANELPGPVLGSITSLTRLTRLKLSAAEGSLPPPVRQLTVLTALRALHLHATRAVGMAVNPWPAPASFPLLQRYSFRRQGMFQLSGTRGCLQLAEYDATVPERCKLELDVASWASLHHMLAAVVPAGRPEALEALQATQCGDEALTAALQGCSQLAGVQQMSLNFDTASLDPATLPVLRALRLTCDSVAIAGGGSTFHNLTSLSLTSDTPYELCGLPALLVAASSLASLTLRGEAAASCLLGLASYEGPLELRHLHLAPVAPLGMPPGYAGSVDYDDFGFDDFLSKPAPLCLPPGPYLSSLEALYLQNCGLNQIPEALASATALRRLDLSQNPLLSISCADVDATLCHLFRLTCLRLSSWDADVVSTEAAVRLFRALPLLKPPDSWR